MERNEIVAIKEQAEAQYKELCAKEHRHRAITWGVQSAYYTAFTIWLQNCWGIVSLVDMLTLCTTKTINTTDPDVAIYDLAHLYEKMIMRSRSNGGYEVGVADLWRFCESFHVDMVIMYAHMGCKSMSGYHGIFEEEARKQGLDPKDLVDDEGQGMVMTNEPADNAENVAEPEGPIRQTTSPSLTTGFSNVTSISLTSI